MEQPNNTIKVTMTTYNLMYYLQDAPNEERFEEAATTKEAIKTAQYILDNYDLVGPVYVSDSDGNEIVEVG
tara:strand:+ start:300 stop:512 length:213 start_codon:yes stop_codon:yes gene_type:complete